MIHKSIYLKLYKHNVCDHLFHSDDNLWYEIEDGKHCPHCSQKLKHNEVYYVKRVIIDIFIDPITGEVTVNY